MIFLWFGLFLIAATGFSMALSIFLTRRHPQQVISSPAEFRLDFENIEFTTVDNLHLRGWWIPFSGSNRTIIFLHGYAGSKDPDLKYAPPIHQAGFNILLFDFRAHGQSDGNLTTLGALETRDVKAAIDYVHSRGSEKIGLLGFSMDGRTALLTAGITRQGISAIVSDGGPLRLSFTILQQVKEKRIPWGLRHILTASILLGATLRTGENLFKADPVRCTRVLRNMPIYLIHAELDPYTRAEDLQKVVAELRENAKLEIVPAVNHRETDIKDFSGYVSRINAFFEDNMK
jgi:pimeloyl-ACP methyl ester carboxylesterase